MQTDYEKMKRLLDKAIEHDLKVHYNLENYQEVTKRISEEEYMKFFDVMEAYYLVNGLIEYYLKDMYYYVRSIMLLSYLLPMYSNVDTMINTVDATHHNTFSHDEIMAIAWELYDRLVEKDYLKTHEFELISDKVKEVLKGKKLVISRDNNYNFTLHMPK